ncbi:MAG TPA: GTP-binding protein, partial [Candidatus Binataceae bacterium]|nr:GTP-binding protein [Candidatus Binataceae bacterium]
MSISPRALSFGRTQSYDHTDDALCPALFDLGEAAKLVIMSVTEGEDKPLKYPHMFRAADVMILNKIDLLPYVKFDLALCIEFARRVNPKLELLKVSASSGEGLQDW